MAELRRLGEADLISYKALRDEMLARHPDAFNSDAAEEVVKPAAHYAGRFGLLEDGPELRFTLGACDAAAGLVGAVSFERDGRIKVRHLTHLVGMMVRPAWRGRGLGAALLREWVAAARAIGGVERATLTVTSSNASAVRLYERGGFVRYGRLEGAIRIGERYESKDLMVLAL